MDILWYIIIGIIIVIIIITIIYFIVRLLNNELFTQDKNDIKSYLSEMIKLQNKQVTLTSNIYNNIIDNVELKNAADFILQNIPPTTKIMEGLLI